MSTACRAGNQRDLTRQRPSCSFTLRHSRCRRTSPDRRCRQEEVAVLGPSYGVRVRGRRGKEEGRLPSLGSAYRCFLGRRFSGRDDWLLLRRRPGLPRGKCCSRWDDVALLRPLGLPRRRCSRVGRRGSSWASRSSSGGAARGGTTWLLLRSVSRSSSGGAARGGTTWLLLRHFRQYLLDDLRRVPGRTSARRRAALPVSTLQRSLEARQVC